MSALPEQAVDPLVLDHITQALGLVAQHGSVDNHPCGCRWNDLTGRWHLCRYHDGMNDGLAMAASPTPTPDHCPTCDSSEDPERTMGGHWTCYDPWHDSGRP
jgi:hypothetical protein